MPQARRRPRKTVEDDLALPADVRAELLDGELYVTPAPWVSPQRMVGALYRFLFEHATMTGSGEVLLSPVDVHLPTGDGVQPDVVYVTKAHQTSSTAEWTASRTLLSR